MSNRDFLREIAFNASQYSREKEYWLNKLSGRLLRNSFPYDFNKVAEEESDRSGSPIKSDEPVVNMERLEFKISGSVFEKLMWTVNNSDLRLFMVLVSGLMVLLARHTGQEDILVGAPIEKQEAEGNFLNTILALRAQLNVGLTFKELLLQVRQVVMEAGEHQNFPIERIPFELNMDIRKNDAFALFDTAILLENLHDRNYIANISLNMVFSFLRTAESLEGVVEYNPTLYKKETIRGITGRFVHLFQETISNLDIPINRLNIMPESEREFLLVKMNDSQSEYPKVAIHELFEAQVENKPGFIAVEEVDTGRTITYEELNRRANQLATLLKEKGLTPGSVAAVMGERTGDIVTSILAILKVGGVFLPLDAQNPDERLHFILEDSSVNIFISQKRIIGEREVLFNGFFPVTIIAMDDEGIYNKVEENPCIAVPPTNPAYIIYTSGTTGKPKGVIVEHRSVVNYIRFAIENYVKEEAVNFPLYTSIAFDLTITSIFTPLVTGNAVVIYSGWNKGNLIERIVDDNKVGVVKLTPSHLYLIGEKKITDSSCKIRRFIVGGEVLKYQIARDISDNFNGKVEIYNEYGPTEATVGCMLYKFDPEKDDDKGSSVSIGVPAANTQIYLLDKNREPVPMGAIGEIYIGGDGLARGYLNRPELTAEKFVNKSFLGGAGGRYFKKAPLLYRTGDLARFLNDGNIDFLGRVDHQVKIRGFRIELGEIESQFLQIKEIKEAVVIIKEATGGNAYGYRAGDSHIFAYFVSSEELNVSELKEYLTEKLPDYMIPSYFIRLDAIPLTPNGKVDVRALPEPELEPEIEYVAPRNEVEKKLVEIWSEILGLDASIIGIDANFFELGGHSLSGTVLTAKIHKALDIKLALADLFRLPTVRELAQHLEKAKKVKFTPIEPVEEKEYYPLSSAQERLFVLQQLDPGSVGYNVPVTFKIEGELSREKIHNTFMELIRRHENFRTSFIIIDDKPVQKLHKNVEFEIEYFDVSGVEPGHLLEFQSQSIINRFIRPFDFSRAPLLRVGLIRTGQSGRHHILMIDIHHIITDGVSMDILFKEIGALYTGSRLSPLKLRYSDFSEWQKSEEVRKEMGKQESYWLKQFGGELPVLELPIDFPRPALQSFEGGRIQFNLDNRDVTGLRELAAAQGVTLFMLMCSLYNIFLSKLSGQEDIIVGSPIAGRRHTDLEYIVGIFINVLALRNYPNGEKTFTEFLQAIKINTLDAYENQEYQYEDLVIRVSVKRDTGRNPLVDAMFAFNNVDMQFLDIPKFQIPDLKIAPYKSDFLVSKVDMLLDVLDAMENMAFVLEYSTKLFKEETIRRFIRYFQQMICVVLANPRQKISEIEILPPEEKKRILYDFNKNEVAYPKDKTIHELFEVQVERIPDRIALVDGCPISLSYRHLKQKSDQLAGLLIEKGLQTDNIVGIMIDRSIEMIIGILGILKAGGAYLPIDPGYPQERIDFMLKDSGAKLLAVADGNEGEKVRRWEGEKVVFEDISKFPNNSSNPLAFLPSYLQSASTLAYTIYTSGSTGKPKGVMVEHGSVVNLLLAMQDEYPFNPEDTYLLKTSYVFDVSVTELFGWAMGGGRLAILEKNGEKDPQVIEKWIEWHHVTHINFVPSMFNAFVSQVGTTDINRLSSLKFIFLAGEALLPEYVKKFQDLNASIRLENIYGPTESSVYSSKYSLADWKGSGNISIGKPIPNIWLYIVDKYNRLQPTLIAGELAIAGVGLARGYLNRPELTMEKFNRDLWDYQDDQAGKNKSFAGGAGGRFFKKAPLFYRTGDLARWIPDGNVEFLGRVDFQVKIRGFRIELGEIENRLTSHNEIKESVVISKINEKGDNYLCAYIVLKRELDVSELRAYLSRELPDYMIPSFFVKLDKIPLTASGKIDRAGLPEPGGIGLREKLEYIPPATVIEKKLAEIWEKVLGRNQIGVNENFFLIGGDSIKSIQIISRMSSAGYKLEMKELFQYPAISKLAPRVKRLDRIHEQSVITGTIPLTPIQEAYFTEFHNAPHHYNQAVMLYSMEGFNKEIILKVFSRLQEHHDALRMIYKRDDDRGKVIQFNQGLEYPMYLEEHDLRNCEDCFEGLKTKANEIQASINLEKGPLLKLGLFHLNDGDRLLIVIHHLVIDGVSWRILFEDIEILYNQHKRGEKLVLPPKTDSFKSWSEKLSTYANRKNFLKEITFWQRVESFEVPPIPKDFAGNDNYIKDIRTESFTLEVEQTELLLTKVNQAFKTEINDILLTMLAMGINKTFGHERVLIALEGHGREEVLEDIDVSRTIGWFTCVYPILIEILHAGDLGRQIKEIKETLRRIPNKGIGYGILKYLTRAENKKEIEFRVKPEISFNYLGQFDADVKQISSFAIAKESTGNSQSPNNRREYVIDVSGMTSNKRLNISFSYNEKHFKPETMTVLIRNFESELKRLIAFCCSKETQERTPADFTYKGLSIETVDRLMKEYPHVEDIYTLTPMQEGLLFHALADDSSYSYFEQMSYRLNGEFDVKLVEKSLNELFKRHDVLRTAFVYKDIERPVQMVLEDRNIDFHYEEISHLKQREEKESFIREFKKRDKDCSFDLSKGTLMRVAVFRLGDAEFEFTWSYHHILMDGWCLGIINTEFFKIYTSYLENKPYRLPQIKPYRTYIQWLERLDREESARYWENYLDSFEEQTGIPRIGKQTKQKNRYKNETVSVELDREKTAALNRLAAGNHVTLNIVTQTLWGILLGKYNGKEDVVFGTVVSGRPFELEGIESMVGLFINTIPVRIQFEEGMKLNSLLRKTQEEALVSEPHHYHPLAVIQARSILKQNLFDHLFAFENYPITERLEGYSSGADVAGKRNSLSFKLTNVDIFEQIHYDFNIVLAGMDRLKITFRYNGNVYDSDFVEKIANRYCSLFDQVSESGEFEIGDLIIVSELEKKQLLYDFNDTEAAYPKDKTIHQLFEEQAGHTPDRIAIFGRGRTLSRTNTDNNMIITYRQLNEQSDQLAGLLIEKGVLADCIVGIMMERSVEMIVGLLGILKSGGAYLPIDPDFPQERIDYMLKDSNAKILINKSEIQNLKSKTIGRSNRELHPSSFSIQHSNHLAYIIYTSGTTGRPKGALIEHGNVVRLLLNDRCLFDFNSNDTWTMFHSYCFDFSVWEMYGALLYGGKLIIIPKIVAQDPQAFLILLKKHRATVLNQTPSAFYNLIIEEMKYPDQTLDLRYVIFGGEALSPAKLKEWQEKYPGTKLINMFGITETTVHVTYKEITTKEIEAGISCIGTPIPTLSTYIFDGGLKLALIGTPGELCVGGYGVGRGYLNRPELSHEKFVRNPYKAHERLYRSGDLARLSADGEMEYLGRIDQQVQIRGFRVEVGEVENRLLKHEDINDVVVIAKNDKESNIFLTAYIVSNRDLSISQLREFIANELPEYMIPSYFVRVPQIPLTLNGKIDRSKLPEPNVMSEEEFVPPANELEEELLAAWKEVLGLEKIGVEDNFFNIGGDSIKVIRLVNSINNRLQANIKILDLFTNNTIRELALVVKSGSAVSLDKELAETEKEVEELKIRIMNSGKMPEDVEDVFPMSDIEKGMIFHAYENPDEAIYHDQFVYHRKFAGFDPDIFRKALNLLTEKHSILRTSFNVNDFDEFVHFIHKAFPAAYQHFEITGLDRQSQEQYIQKYMENDRKDRWDITTLPLCRMATFDLGDDNIYAVWTFHHAILDGWSNASLMTELNNVYLALKVDKDYNPGRLKISYKDFVIREMIEKRKTGNIDFWKNELEDYKRISFPGIGKKERGEIHDFLPPPFMTSNEELQNAARRFNTSLKHICFAAYVYMLSMLTYESDVVMGLVSNNRLALEDGDKLIGCFLNTLPFRINIPAGITWEDFIRMVDRKLLHLKKYDKITFYEIAKIIGERNYAGNLVFDTIFNYVDFHIFKQVLEETDQTGKVLDSLIQGYERTNTLFDLSVRPYFRGIKVTIRYSTSIASDEIVKQLYDYYEKVLTMIVSQPQRLINKDEILSDEEKQELLAEFNNTEADYPRGKTIHGLFEEQAARTPDRIAVFGHGRTLSRTNTVNNMIITYRQLNEQSNQQAQLLIEKGVLADHIVAIMVERSLAMIIGIFGILKAGGAYLPIDPEYPQERIDYMLKDSNVKILINKSEARSTKFETNPNDQNPNDQNKSRNFGIPFVLDFEHLNFEFVSSFDIRISDLNSSNLAYIIYTSGTTGKPKGVLIEHKNVVRLLFNDGFQFDFNERDVWSLFHSYSFDFSVWEMYGALLYGGKLAIIPRSITLDPGEFLQVLKDQQVTVLNQTPSAFYNLIYEESKQNEKELNIRYVIFGGEALQPGKLKEWYERYPKTVMVNMFGITETTVHVTYREIGAAEIEAGISNIGRPIPTLSAYIMDMNQHLVLPGVSGELCVGGEGVARGYLNRPELTSQKFLEVQKPFFKKVSGPRRVYRSGDLARAIAGEQETQIEYLGRIDQQVQLRGFRVELGEIQSLLLKHEHIKDAVVIDGSDEQGDHYLCAYVVPNESTSQTETLLDTPALQNYLSRLLPGYMIPPYFVQLAEIPLTANGKVDRKQLPPPRVSLEGTYTAPRTKEEALLVEIWQEVLELERVGIDDNFFNVGGDSIKTIRLSSTINSRLNSHIKILDLYTHGTIRQLATLLNRQETFDREYLHDKVTNEIEALKARVFAQKSELVDIVEDVYPMSDIEKGLVFYYLKYVGTGIYHDQFVYPFYYKDLDVKRFEWAIQLLMEKHSILRTTFNLDDFEESVSIVYKKVAPDFTYLDLSGLSSGEQQRRLADFLARDRKNYFSASTAPLWRVGLFELGNGSLYFTLVFHHALLDGWSTASLATEVHNIYRELENDLSYTPAQLKSNYKDTVIEELIVKQGPESREYWRKELEEYPRLEFSESLKSKSEMEGMITFRYNAGVELLEQLNHCADRLQVSIKNLCFGAYACFMNMFSYEDDVVVGVVTNIRTEKEDSDKVLGCFLNTVPVRLKIPRGITWKEYLQLVEKKMLEVKKYERLSLFEIAAAIGEKSKDRNPIFDSLFNFMDFHIFRQVKSGEKEEKDRSRRVVSQDNDSGRPPVFIETSQDTNTLFDFEVDITQGMVMVSPKYNRSAISDVMVQRCCGYFLNILQKYIGEPDGIVRNDAILSSEEKEQVLYQFNDTAAPYSREKTMHQLFEEQVLRSSESAAVIDRDGVTQWTYEELNKHSNRLAGLLRKRGLKPGGLIAVIMDRSIHMVAAVMGILKAGGAYVPLEPYLPDERIRKLLESLHIETIIVNEAQLLKVNRISQPLPGLTHLVCPDKNPAVELETDLFTGKELIGPVELAQENVKNPAPAAKSGDISYIIFTSGSTGTPKGVVETHRPVINVIEWVNKTFGVGYPDKLLFVASLGFDLSVYDIFGILASGACLRVVGAEDIKDPGKLLDIIMIERITFWDSAPAALQQLAPFLPEVVSYAEPGRLRLVFLSGDWIPVSMPDALREAFEGVRVISLGGATEATVWSNYYPIGEVDPSWPSIPYGKPIQNAKYYILDRNLEVCPLRVPGDLYIGGECLAVEYINDTALSAHKFIANPFENGEKIYRTGDIARWFEDGNMQFLGRKDQQVKIRGYRIELGEIESQLTSHPQVSDGIVLDRVDGTGNKYLCAYYVSKVKGEEIDREELKEYLLRELPEYMIPAYFIAIEKIPLTANGKLDRKGLPEPEASSESGVEFMAPENETQAKLVEVWAQVLGVEKEKIGITADFFQLGGHSLNATMVISRIHKEFNVKVPLAEIFNSPTIRELSRKIKTSESEIYAAIESVEKKEYYRLSSAQRRLYFLQQMEPGNTGYNIQEGVLLEGDVDIPVLEETFRKLIQRHESLRTSFEIVNDETVQRVHDNVEFKIEYYGGAAKNVKGPEENQSFIRAFDLSEAPLLRVGLSRLEEKKHVLLVDMHHIISDGVSHAVLKGDFGILFSGGQLPPIRLQYKDFSEWQHSEKQQELVGKQRAYWLNELSGDIPVLDIPTDYPRPMIQGYEGNTLEFDLGHEETALLNQLGREEKATLYMVLVAIYNVLLFKLGNQEEIIIGTPTAGRRHPDLERIMGMFVNTLVLKNYPIGEKPFTNFLQEVKEKTIKAFENQDYPFEELVERLVIKRDASRNPLFDVLFVLQNMAVETEGTSGASTGDSKVRLQPYRYSAAISKFDLTLSAVESGTGIHFSFEYCTRLFKEETIQRVIEYFKRIVSVVTGAKSKTLAGIEILSDEEKNLLLFEFNDTAAEYPRDKTIHGLFAEQVERTPDRIGLVGDVRHVGHVGLTYQKLNQQSSQLAQLLIEKGVLAGHIVAIMLERSIELIIGIFGILKAGGAYLPIDPEYPQERIDYMFEDSNALVLIDEKFFKGSKAPRRGEPIKVIQKSPPASANLAYIIYTSGSTGNPKGVMIEHHSVVNRLHWMQKCYPIGAGDVLLQKTPTVFDVSVWELFWWAMEGASLRLLGVGEEKNPEAIIDAIARSRVTAMHFVPSMLQVFLDYCEGSADMTMLSSLRQVFASGEALNVHQVEKFIQLLNEKNGTRLINLYGPTEATVDVSYYDCTPGQDVMDIPIGRPIDNIGLYVVDKNLNLQPVGVKGELCISGVGLARGYLNNPELAAEKFTKFNRSNKSNRTYTIYRTGDLARLLGNGQVEYLGRIDHQVKIRGFRVELGEIENQLLGNEKIKGAVVLLKDQHLYAYIAVKGEGEFNSSILRSYLSDKLPAYMIPSSFVQVEEIPLTANGKVDRKALDRTGKKLASDAAYIAPQNELEKKIAEVWKEVLHLERVGIHDNYFELGGTSFDIVKINRKLKELFQIEVPLVVMFRHTTVHGFAAYLNKESGDIHDRAAALERGKRDKRERLQRRKGAGTHPPIQKVEIV